MIGREPSQLHDSREAGSRWYGSGLQGFDFSGIWEGGNGSIHYEFAAAHAQANRATEAEASLRAAWAAGWREFPRLEREPELARLRQALPFQSAVTDLASRDPGPLA